MRVDQEFRNVLLNIEVQVIDIAHDNPEIADYQVEKVYSALLSKYKALARGKEAKDINFKNPTDLLYDQVNGVCGFFVGDIEPENEDGEVIDIPMEKISYQDMIACLKYLRKSVKLWNKEGGQKGYLNYVEEFVPVRGKV